MEAAQETVNMGQKKDSVNDIQDETSQASEKSPASITDNSKVSKKKEKRLYEEIEIPEGITVNVGRTEISMKKDDKEIVLKNVLEKTVEKN